MSDCVSLVEVETVESTLLDRSTIEKEPRLLCE